MTFTPDPVPGRRPATRWPSRTPTSPPGPFAGFKGLITPYTLTVTAESTTGNSEVRLRRELQTVAVPVFQFGIFGEKSLGFHAGPNFDFGGRVHTNQSLYLAAGTSSTLTFRDKITAFTAGGPRAAAERRAVTQTNHEGIVEIPRSSAASTRLPTATCRRPRPAAPAEPCIPAGSMTACWTVEEPVGATGTNGYATNIRTEATGAKQLNLPLATQGAQPIDLIRRPVVNSNEDTANPPVFGQRFFAQASLRILLSDRRGDITNLPTVTGPPLALTRGGAARRGLGGGPGRVIGTSTR